MVWLVTGVFQFKQVGVQQGLQSLKGIRLEVSVHVC